MALTNPNIEDSSLTLDPTGRALSASKSLSDYQKAETADLPNLFELGAQLRATVVSLIIYYGNLALATQMGAVK